MCIWLILVDLAQTRRPIGSNYLTHYIFIKSLIIKTVLSNCNNFVK
nr:MAG TPA: hypothetical protein [Caudoviricetes sp.]